VNAGSEKYFDKEAYLTVSGQLHLEAVLNAFGKVFTISPAFRAEKSLSRRHLSEFTMLEVEEAFTDELDVLMDRAEDLIRFIGQHVLEHFEKDLSFLLSLPSQKIAYRVIDRMTHQKRAIR
jgi:asparaginyl-tRNA synthetase